MNRSVDELLAAFRFAIDNGSVHSLLIGDNELARLVVEFEALRDASPSARTTSVPEELRRLSEKATPGPWKYGDVRLNVGQTPENRFFALECVNFVRSLLASPQPSPSGSGEELVARLRKLAELFDGHEPGPQWFLNEAADELSRLRAENAELREQVERLSRGRDVGNDE